MTPPRAWGPEFHTLESALQDLVELSQVATGAGAHALLHLLQQQLTNTELERVIALERSVAIKLLAHADALEQQLEALTARADRTLPATTARRRRGRSAGRTSRG